VLDFARVGADKVTQVVSKSSGRRQLHTIAVDLTPVLPGGENGGAKVFVIELIRRLAERTPQTQFVLLTQAAAHEELAALDSANVRRLMVVDYSATPTIRSLATKVFSRLLAHLPGRLRSTAVRLAYWALISLKRTGSRSVLGDLNADLLFCPFTAPTYFELGIPTVCVIYDLQYKTYPEFFAPEDVAYRNRTFIEAARRSTALAAISNYSRDMAISVGKLDPASIKTINLHISQHSLRNAPRDESILGRLQLTTGRYLIYPANFWRHKNHEMLLTAFGLARHGGLADDIRLVCTGAHGERQQWLERSSRQLGLGDHILFPGYLANAELLALVANSAGVIFPSLYEGFGLPIIEAMATGVPVACSNVTSLPEVAGNGAILFDPRIPEQIAQAIVSLAQDKELTARLVRLGDARASRFCDSGIMAEQYWELFQGAVGLAHQSNVLVGVDPDGWAGPKATLQIAPSMQARTLDLEVALPAAAPVRVIKLRITHDQEQKAEITVLRGEHSSVSIPLPSAGGYFNIHTSPSSVPALTGGDNDDRQLSVRFVRCDIAGADGQRDALIAESRSP
jgi:glycosyltransferase involved in cell wall biosynthesis